MDGDKQALATAVNAMRLAVQERTDTEKRLVAMEDSAMSERARAQHLEDEAVQLRRAHFELETRNLDLVAEVEELRHSQAAMRSDTTLRSRSVGKALADGDFWKQGAAEGMGRMRLMEEETAKARAERDACKAQRDRAREECQALAEELKELQPDSADPRGRKQAARCKQLVDNERLANEKLARRNDQARATRAQKGLQAEVERLRAVLIASQADYEARLVGAVADLERARSAVFAITGRVNDGPKLQRQLAASRFKVTETQDMQRGLLEANRELKKQADLLTKQLIDSRQRESQLFLGKISH